MNLLAAVGASAWARGFKPVQCGRGSCGRWLTERQLSVRRVGVTMADTWYCGYRCFHSVAEERFARLLATPPAPRHRTQAAFGLTLIRLGLLNDTQHKTVCEIERESGREFGEIATELGIVTVEQVTKARAVQWNCPVFALSVPTAHAYRSIPFTLMQRHAMIPLCYAAAGNRLFVGFKYKVDYAALFAIEQVLGCTTQPCILPPAEFDSLLRKPRQLGLGCERYVEDAVDSATMASTLCTAGASIDADHIAIVRCGDRIWARLKNGTRSSDLLFDAGCIARSLGNG